MTDPMWANFTEWFVPGEDEVSAMIRDATIALDANVLLDLYRLGSTQREEILALLKNDAVRSRVWIPYQAALEFHRNRFDVSRDQQKQYDDVGKAIADLRGTLTRSIESIRDKAVAELLASTADEVLAAATHSLQNSLNQIRSENLIEHKIVRRQDPVVKAIREIVTESDQVGVEPDDATYSDRVAESKRRYAEKIPPGYKDQSPGDYLIWMEILDRVESSGADLLFVSSDLKEDWQRKDGHERVGPRTELLVEFDKRKQSVSQRFHHLSLESFLVHSRDALGARVDDSTLNQIKSLDSERLEGDVILSRLRHPSYVSIGIDSMRDTRDGPLRARMGRLLDVINGAPATLAELRFLDAFVRSEKFRDAQGRIKEDSRSADDFAVDVLRDELDAREISRSRPSDYQTLDDLYGPELGLVAPDSNTVPRFGSVKELVWKIEDATVAVRVDSSDQTDRSVIASALEIQRSGRLSERDQRDVDAALRSYFAAI